MAKKAFVIGINTLGLKYCLHDAVLMNDCLTLHGYDVITFKTAKDKRYILDQFDILIDDCDKTDTLIFYFSGHGVIHKGNLRLILADDTSKRSSRLEMREITDAFDDCAASSKLIILDCCHAGTVHADWNPVSSEFYRLLTASGRLEKAKETDSLEAGFMTYHIHQCLINPPSEAADDNNIIRIGSLYKQLVRAAEKHIGSDDPVKVPIPNLLGNAKADFEIATKMADHKSGIDETKQVLQEQKAEQRYQELALESCDIVDLANLPESDRHIATRQRELQLRRLYVALRVKIEISFDMEADEDDLEAIEKRRLKMLWLKTDEQEEEVKRFSIGERLAKARRVVVLGDPGAGKTTMIRWIATAYLLRLKHDPDWQELPDIATLPDENWMPIIIRCRDLDHTRISGSLDDMLRYTLRKTEMNEADADALRMVLRSKLESGQALLLIDGLDEISDPGARIRFCKQVENMQIAYPNAPMIVTSRIVGYREMGYRIRRGFEHVTVDELTKEDKDDFAQRWCAVTEPPERCRKAVDELIRDIHSADRIERLTGNPMLLTTMALVKRKVGKLPSRRADLYWEAVQVLLNWRSEVDTPIDQHEAIPQLEYVAYAMCDRGVQQLREDEIIDLFTQLREEYPNIYAVQNHTPDEFLRLLERRTGILVEIGNIRHLGRPVPVFEFRHLTFQEYLAGLALVDGRFPNRDKSCSLADYVAPLAGRTSQSETGFGETEITVTENWREALRLCVASCDDDDVNDVLQAIITPLPNEDASQIARPRAILACLCLADEPNVTEETAKTVLQAFVKQIGKNDGSGHIFTSCDATAMELAVTRWNDMLRFYLIEEFCQRNTVNREKPGGLCAMIKSYNLPDDQVRSWLMQQVDQIVSGDESIMIDAALGVMIVAYKRKTYIIPELVDCLIDMLTGTSPVAHAGAWALRWLNDGNTWQPSAIESKKLIDFISNQYTDKKAVWWVTKILASERETRAVEPLIARLDDKYNHLRQEVITALGEIGDARAVEPLIAKLDDQNSDVHLIMKALGNIGNSRAVETLRDNLTADDKEIRQSALGGLSKTCQDIIDRRLLYQYINATEPLLDPKEDIGEKQIERAVKILRITKEEVRQRYEALSRQFGLKLAWQNE